MHVPLNIVVGTDETLALHLATGKSGSAVDAKIQPDVETLCVPPENQFPSHEPDRAHRPGYEFARTRHNMPIVEQNRVVNHIAGQAGFTPP